MTRRAAKVDSNHAEIRDGLRELGFIVKDTSRHGDGLPDLVVLLKSGRAALLLEVKDTNTEISKSELQFMVQIVEPVYRIVTTVEQAAAALQESDK